MLYNTIYQLCVRQNEGQKGAKVLKGCKNLESKKVENADLAFFYKGMEGYRY